MLPVFALTGTKKPVRSKVKFSLNSPGTKITSQVMPTAKELNIQVENRPGMLAKLCKGLADRKVSIVAFQASTEERRRQVS